MLSLLLLPAAMCDSRLQRDQAEALTLDSQIEDLNQRIADARDEKEREGLVTELDDLRTQKIKKEEEIRERSDKYKTAGDVAGGMLNVLAIIFGIPLLATAGVGVKRLLTAKS
jgi:uncharacterized protein (DUF3084 family)